MLKLNADLVQWAYHLTKDVPLKDSDDAKAYRMRYPDTAARRAPFVGMGTHMCGDTFFHGPGLSKEAQYICDLYGASTYVITEMEGAAVAYVIKKILSLDRVMSLRTAVNFDQGNANETTLQHFDPEPGNTPGGFGVGVENNCNVGAVMVDHIVANWEQWKQSIPPLGKNNCPFTPFSVFCELMDRVCGSKKTTAPKPSINRPEPKTVRQGTGLRKPPTAQGRPANPNRPNREIRCSTLIGLLTHTPQLGYSVLFRRNHPVAASDASTGSPGTSRGRLGGTFPGSTHRRCEGVSGCRCWNLRREP